MTVHRKWVDFVMSNDGGPRRNLEERLDTADAFVPKSPGFEAPAGGGLFVVTWSFFDKHYLSPGDKFEAMQFHEWGEVTIWSRDCVYYLAIPEPKATERIDEVKRHPPTK
jgi:hypothetical protein